jgi:glycosyltransferase involved in cell wall biosynthesis
MAISNERIFVQMPSYRDTECQWTIKDLFEKAKHPERVFVGVCRQFVPEEDQGCFKVVMRPEQVRTVEYHVKESLGVGWARNQAQMLCMGEEYTLQIDAHMRFVPEWDARMIELLRRCRSPNSLLTSYPPAYTPPDERPSEWIYPLVPDHFAKDGVLHKRQLSIRVKEAPKQPRLSGCLMAALLFGSARVIAEVPADPYMYYSTETTEAARLWTHGWDLFEPYEVLLYHYYGREGHHRPWHDDNSWRQLLGRTTARLRHIMGMEISGDPAVTAELGKYGLGTARSLADYEEFYGVDFKMRAISDRARQGHFPAGRPVADSSVTTERLDIP